MSTRTVTSGRIPRNRLTPAPGRHPREVRLRRPQRVTLHSWAFAQLGQFITYKAARAGVPVVRVDPAYTSQGCSACGHVDKKNRPGQATFLCTSCGFAGHADVNAARNIAARGEAGWADLSQPHAACPSQPVTGKSRKLSPSGPGS